MNSEILALIEAWKNENRLDKELKLELGLLDEEKLYDAFYTNLSFGTGGLRGILGVGTNRMNIHTVKKATKGFIDYLLEKYPDTKEKGVVIAYDCRHHSKDFAKATAEVIASTGTKVYVFTELRPTPELSFAVRYLKCVGGIMITASHNPPAYNGYKVYDHNGCQLTPNDATKVIAKINNIADLFAVDYLDYEVAKKEGLVVEVDKEIDDEFIKATKTVTINKLSKECKDNYKIVFTPLHGTACVSLPYILKSEGFNVTTVDEQMIPDPEFSTVASPNPENKSAFVLAEKLGKEINADLLLATDPDADRMGIGVLHNGKYEFLTGNQTGLIIIDYLGKFVKPKKKGVVFNTVVTSNSGYAIAKKYNLKLRQTLTGFKFIGEQIAVLEGSEEEEFFFGYEESYGYVIKDHVRDKDSLQSCLLLSEIAAYYKDKGLTLVDVLNNIYDSIGYYEEGIYNLQMEGAAGAKKIEAIVRHFQNEHYKEIADRKVMSIEDFDKQLKYYNGTTSSIQLPKSLVIKYIFEDGSWFVLRPSGTEPKLKVYFSFKGETKGEARKYLEDVKESIINIINQI